MAEETLTKEEMKAAAEASAKTATKAREEASPTGVGVMRKRGGDSRSAEATVDSDIPYPVELHGEDFADYGPSGFAAVIPVGTEIAPYTQDQEFMIDPARVMTLKFQEAGRNLPKKRLYNIKGIHKDGRLVQLPFELQIQNNAGGDPQDAIGLRRYQRKGIFVLIDWENLAPIYCAAWDCWARAANAGQFIGFCTERHARHTLPNRYKGAGEIVQGLLEAGVTTTNTWSV